MVLDFAHVRAKKRGEITGPSPVDRGKPGSEMHILSDANELSLVVGVSVANAHDGLGVKPMVAGLQTRHAPENGCTTSPASCTRRKHTAYLTCVNGCVEDTSESALPAKALNPAND